MIETLYALEVLPESTLRSVVDVMVRLVEACGAVVIVIGALVAIVKFVMALVRRDIGEFSSVRLTLGRFLALGLEFQLASDVLARRSLRVPGDRQAGGDRRHPYGTQLLPGPRNRRGAARRRGGEGEAVRPGRVTAMTVAADLSWLVAGAGIVLGTATLVVFRRPVLSLHVLLDLLLAAGLLRLSADAGWPVIAVTAAVVVLRRLLTFSLLFGLGRRRVDALRPDGVRARRPVRW